MGLYTTRGIVLRCLKYKESSVICDIYTESKGLRSFIVNGVRSKRSKSSSSIFQHMNILNLVAYDVEGDKLGRLKEYSMAHIYSTLPFDVLRFSIGTFAIELARNSIREREENIDVFEYLHSWFLYVDSPEVYLPSCHIKFLLDLSQLLGFGPLDNFDEFNTLFDLVNGQFVETPTNKYTLAQESSEFLHKLMKEDIATLNLVAIPKKYRKHLIDSLLDYYKLHLPNFQDLKSYAVLEELLS